MFIDIQWEQGNSFPRIGRIRTDATLAQVTTAGFLNGAVSQGIVIQPSDKFEIYYGINGTPANAFFDVSISSGIITLSVAESNVILPVVSGNFAVWSGTSGALADLGYLPSNAALTRVVMAGSAVQVGYLAKYADVNGTIDDTPGTAINAGVIQSGLSGTVGGFVAYPPTAANGFLQLLAVNAGGAFNTIISNSVIGQTSTISIPDPGAATANFVLTSSAGGSQSLGGNLTVAGAITSTAGDITSGSSGDAGSFVSFPATAANGTLIVAAANAGGAFNSTISNGTMGQSSVFTMPDPANALAQFLVGATATPFVSGNFPVASGVAGLMVDSGLAAANIQNRTNIVAATTADIGGGGVGPISVVVAGATAASVVVATVESSSNPVSVVACTATATGFDITFSADPGAACLVNYVLFIAAQ